MGTGLFCRTIKTKQCKLLSLQNENYAALRHTQMETVLYMTVFSNHCYAKTVSLYLYRMPRLGGSVLSVTDA